jgi:hypothetical protein
MSHPGHDTGPGHVPGSHVHPEHQSAPAAPVSVPARDDLAAAALGAIAGQHDLRAAPGQAGTAGSPATFGDPGEYQHYWFYQGDNPTCWPASITQVIEAQTGITLHGEAMVQHELRELGLPSGNLHPLQAQALLSKFDIPSHLESYPHDPSGALAQLKQYLDGGRNVVLTVNASPIWYDSQTLDNPNGAEPDHAVVITAIDTKTGMVTLSDTGNPGGDDLASGIGNHDGNQEQVPLGTLMGAWGYSDYTMLVTDDRVGGADQHAATQAVISAGGAPAPGAGFPAAAAAAAGSVLLAAALGLRWITRSRHTGRGGTGSTGSAGGNTQPGHPGTPGTGPILPPVTGPETAR